MNNRIKYIVLSVLMIITLCGCSNTENNVDIIDYNADDRIVQHNTYDDNSSYANDNITNKTDDIENIPDIDYIDNTEEYDKPIIIDSGIYADDNIVEYNYTVKTYEFYDDTEYEDIELSEEQQLNNLIELLQYDIYGKLKNLGGRAFSNFDAGGINSMHSSIEQCYYSMLRADEYNDVVNKYLASDENIINNWNKIKSNIDKWKEILKDIDTADKYYKSDLSVDELEITDLDNFINSVIEHLDNRR